MVTTHERKSYLAFFVEFLFVGGFCEDALRIGGSSGSFTPSRNLYKATWKVKKGVKELSWIPKLSDAESARVISGLYMIHFLAQQHSSFWILLSNLALLIL